MALIIPLTSEQIQSLSSLQAEISKAAEADKPGMLVAQVFGTTLQVHLFTHEQGLLLQAQFGVLPGEIIEDIVGGTS